MYCNLGEAVKWLLGERKDSHLFDLGSLMILIEFHTESPSFASLQTFPYVSIQGFRQSLIESGSILEMEAIVGLTEDFLCFSFKLYGFEARKLSNA